MNRDARNIGPAPRVELWFFGSRRRVLCGPGAPTPLNRDLLSNNLDDDISRAKDAPDTCAAIEQRSGRYVLAPDPRRAVKLVRMADLDVLRRGQIQSAMREKRDLDPELVTFLAQVEPHAEVSFADRGKSGFDLSDGAWLAIRPGSKGRTWVLHATVSHQRSRPQRHSRPTSLVPDVATTVDTRDRVVSSGAGGDRRAPVVSGPGTSQTGYPPPTAARGPEAARRYLFRTDQSHPGAPNLLLFALVYRMQEYIRGDRVPEPTKVAVVRAAFPSIDIEEKERYLRDKLWPKGSQPTKVLYAYLLDPGNELISIADLDQALMFAKAQERRAR